ncbi:MAG TPA: hypothetical protein PLL17_01475 [Defluviitaleaceae bacterium]|nr:hypothetical protein [Candidatus Epulonipiscium sp.]HOQ16560.1 hypothetical protein [Defluviitaleaceae bacterium]HPT76209.1 hypothetical protein [Defluviitaleaceae bacterium]HQD49790.1 hypothetical protein [Defluviitaleaceae bacterium]
MKVAKNYYTGDSIKNKERIVKRLIKNYLYKDIYCLCLEPSSEYLMVIIKTNEMKNNISRYRDCKVVGIARNKEEAFELTRRIIDDVYKKYKDPMMIKEFFAWE